MLQPTVGLASNHEKLAFSPVFPYDFLGLAASILEKGGITMEQIYFGERIAALRKARGMTQEALAQRLGITNQAVSKWESDQCCPDIMQLPALADIFEISMDALFGRREPQPVSAAVTVSDLPWEDNQDLHAVCYVGHRLVSFKDIPAPGGKRDLFSFSFSCRGIDMKNPWSNDPVVLEFSGTVDNIYSDFSVSVQNSEIGGKVQAGDSVSCGDVAGDAYAGGDLRCEGKISRNATAGGDVECAEIIGRVNCGGDLSCRGSIHGDIRAEGDIECSGDIAGNVAAEGDVTCTGSIGGNAAAEGDITCGTVQGSASAGGDITCSAIGGSASAEGDITISETDA